MRGPNGVGKSSLLRILAGLLRAQTGLVRLSGAGDDEAENSLVHYLGHQDGLRDALSALENLTFLKSLLGASDFGTSPAEAMKVLGVLHLSGLPVAVLSAGQRRRVALAGLIAVGRPIWLLDEPTTALDSAAQTLVASVLAQHCAKGGVIVAATHLPLGFEARELDLGAQNLGALSQMGAPS